MNDVIKVNSFLQTVKFAKWRRQTFWNDVSVVSKTNSPQCPCSSSPAGLDHITVVHHWVLLLLIGDVEMSVVLSPVGLEEIKKKSPVCEIGNWHLFISYSVNASHADLIFCRLIIVLHTHRQTTTVHLSHSNQPHQNKLTWSLLITSCHSLRLPHNLCVCFNL